MSTKEKPDFVTDEHLEYLDALRESGITNMFGAASYINRDFGMNMEKSTETLCYWMDTFSDRQGA